MSAEMLRAGIEALIERESWRYPDTTPCINLGDLRALLSPARTEAVGSEWDGPLLACAEAGRDDFWSYQECPRGVTGMSAHRRLGLVHRIRAADRRHACEDVIHPSISTSHRRSVAVEDTAADLAPVEVGGGS